VSAPSSSPVGSELMDVYFIRAAGAGGVFRALCQSASKEASPMKKGLTDADRKRKANF